MNNLWENTTSFKAKIKKAKILEINLMFSVVVIIIYEVVSMNEGNSICFLYEGAEQLFSKIDYLNAKKCQL